MYMGLLLFSFLLEFAQTYIMQWTGQKVMFDLRSQIFRHLQRLHISFFDRNPVGRLVTRVTTDVDALNEMFTAGVVSIFEDVFVLAGILVIMLNMNWRLALITFAVLPFIFYATSIFRRKVRESYRRIRIAIARINAYLQEHVTGIVVLQLFNREKTAYERFEKINRTHMDAFKDAILAHAVYYPVVEVLSSVAIACVIWFGGNQVIRKLVTLGVLVAFMQYAQRFFRPIQDLSEKYNILQSAMASSERVFKLLDTPAEIVSPAQPKVREGAGRIEFDHVWFAYRTMAQAAEEAAQQRREVEDRGGSGQWRPRHGIRLGAARCVVHHRSGRDRRHRRATPAPARPPSSRCCCASTTCSRAPSALTAWTSAKWNLNDLRRRFGVVLQDPFLFSGTLAANIRLGSQWIERCVGGRRRRAGECRRFHSLAAGRLRRRSAGARQHALHRTEAAHLVCPRAGAQSQDPDSG